MPITPYLRHQAFDPETIQVMGIAFEKTCRTLGLSLTADPVTEHVAKIIIELAQRGERDPERLFNGVLLHFDKSD
jgi:hypothetical protein